MSVAFLVINIITRIEYFNRRIMAKIYDLISFSFVFRADLIHQLEKVWTEKIWSNFRFEVIRI